MSISEINRLVNEELEAELTNKIYFLKQEYGPNDYYVGNWDSETDLYHGYGKLQLPNNLGYVGYWLLGKYHGDNEDNVLRTKDLYYKGGFKHGLYHGKKSTLRTTGGVHYRGGFYNGLYHGKQCVLKTNVIKYDGGFTRGKYNGQYCTLYEQNGEDGTIIEYAGGMSDGLYANGSHVCTLKITRVEDNAVQHYVGGFREGKFSGKGKLEMFDGTKYNGSFKDGEFHGNGHLFTSLYIYKGYWMNGAYHGKGEIKWLVGSHGNRKMVKGYFRNGILHGINCRILYKDGSKYIGSIEYDRYAGKGVYFNSNGEKVYEGCWLANKYHGAGKLFRNDGSISYEGGFSNGLRHGWGKYIRKDGSIQYNGTSTNNRMTGCGTYYFPSGAIFKGEVVDKIAHGFGESKDKFGNEFKGWFRDGKRYRAYVKPKTPRSGSTKRTSPNAKVSSNHASVNNNTNDITAGAGNNDAVGITNDYNNNGLVRNLQSAGTTFSFRVNDNTNRPATAYLPPVNAISQYNNFSRNQKDGGGGYRPTSSMNWSRR